MFKEKFLKQHPEIKTAQQIRGKISDEEMQEMNYKVTVKMKIRIMLRNIILKRRFSKINSHAKMLEQDNELIMNSLSCSF